MIRVQQLIFPATLMGCLMVIVLTSLLANPQEAVAAASQALHTSLGTWKAAEWRPLLEPAMADEATRKAYD